MKHRALVILLLLFLQSLSIAEVGLYEVSDDLHAVRPVNDTVSRVTLYSVENNNSSYSLNFYRSEPFSLPHGKIGVLVGDKVIRLNQSGSGNNVGGQGFEYSIGGTVDDINVITQIIEHFHPTVHKRQHPGHQMLVSLVPDKNEFAVGEKVTVTLNITNIGNKTFTFVQGGRQRGFRDNQFAFSAAEFDKMLPDIGNPNHFGGIGGYITLKSGETRQITVDLDNWFQFKKPGFYSLRGSYYMSFINEEHVMIWEDFACAEFSVHIRGMQDTPSNGG